MPIARIINPPAELYLDGLFCYNQISTQTNDFLKWRYARLATLTFYSSIELAINTVHGVNPRSKMPVKWRAKINPNKEPEAWENFLRFKKIRIAITHNDEPNKVYQRMYDDLINNIDEIRNTARSMLVRIYSEQVLDNWEQNITLSDAS